MYYYPINYKIFGKGKKFVLFLHGWGGSTNSFLSVANRVAINHKVILVDFYGFGKSRFPDNPIDTYEYTIQIYLLLKSKNITNFDIVAHSFGGRIAIVLSSLFDLKVDKMVLIGSAGVLPKRTMKYRINIIRYRIYKKLSKLKLVSPKKLSQFGSDEYKQLNTVQKLSYVKIVNQGLEYLMAKVDSKVLLVWGMEDKSTPIYMARIMNRLIKDSKLFIYNNSGHFCYLENYISFCNLLLTFLKE